MFKSNKYEKLNIYFQNVPREFTFQDVHIPVVAIVLMTRLVTEQLVNVTKAVNLDILGYFVKKVCLIVEINCKIHVSLV